MMNNLETGPGDLAERFDLDPDMEEFWREVRAAGFMREQQRVPKGSVSQDEIYRVACAFLAVLIIIIVLAIWFSVT